MSRSEAPCICMYTPSAYGGHPQYTQELLTALALHPGSSLRYELVSSQNLAAQYDSDLYRVHRILTPLLHRSTFATPLAWVASRMVYYPRREWQFLKWLQARPDIVGVHFQEWTPWLAAPLFRYLRRLGKKTFYTVHNLRPHKYPAYVPRGVVHGWIRRGCLQADGLFVLSEVLAEELANFLGPAHPPIYVAPHGVWTVARARDGNRPPMGERLSWKRLLFFGAIRRDKGLDLLLRAAERLPGYAITIAGEPVEPPYFQTEVLPLVRRLQQNGCRIDLIDRFVTDEEVVSLFAAHSAVVMPYTAAFASQSGVVFMALAHEVPVVASEVGGLRDLFAEFTIGRTFHQPAPAELAAAIDSLHADGAAGALAEGIRAARQRFSWQTAASATAAGYAAALETGREECDCPVPTAAAG